MIKANNVIKTYYNEQEQLRVLNNLDFFADKGEFAMITGASGCGKSTLLNVLSCLDNFDSGDLYINNNLIDPNLHKQLYNMRRKDIGFIFQAYNLISSMTALENVMLTLKYSGYNYLTRRQMAISSLEKVGLKDKLNSVPHRLSGGQQQRVAVARALVTKPKILFCDEPTGNLDKETSAMVMDSIISLQKSGTTVVMITHDPSLLKHADSAYKLVNGKLQFV